MKVYVYHHLPTININCHLEEQTNPVGRLIQTIEAEPTEEPITTNWQSSRLIELGEVFACNGTETHLKRIS